MRRFYHPKKLSVGKSIVVSGSDARHIYKVLRLKPGDTIFLFDGRGHEFESRIIEASFEEVAVVVVKDHPSKSEAGVNITLAQAMLKSKKMDTLVRQVTELGISKWVPFYSKRSVPTPDHIRLIARLERWNKIVREALKQCNRSSFMEICSPVSFEEILKQGESCDLKVLFWEDESASLDAAISSQSKMCDDIIVVLGPEGGFSSQEIAMAKSYGYVTASLGPRILKAETASISAAVLMQYRFGDMGGKPELSDC